MEQPQRISEKIYPIKTVWLIKPILRTLPVLAFLIVVIAGSFDRYKPNTFFYLVVFLLLMQGVYPILFRANFHYLLEERLLTIKQGILSKQQKHIPYGVIQNIFVKQDIFDRIFNLASVSIENASQAGGVTVSSYSKGNRYETIGFRGNKVVIPGLQKEDAESLKGILLERMKANPIDDSQSGL